MHENDNRPVRRLQSGQIDGATLALDLMLGGRAEKVRAARTVRDIRRRVRLGDSLSIYQGIYATFIEMVDCLRKVK